MKKNEKLLESIGSISNDLISGAAPQETTTTRGFFTMKRAFALAASMLLVFALSVSALAAADYDPAYKLLYSLSPAVAQRLKPVRLASEDNGIRLEVVSARVAGSDAEVYLSFQDLEGDRIDQTTDLFDSYGINAPFESSSSCVNVGYDSQTKTASFLVSIAQLGGQEIAGSKITFGVRQLLSKKQTFDAAIPELGLTGLSANPDTIKPAQLFGGGGEGFEASSQDFRALAQQAVICSPVKGVSITAMGYVDGKLHIQVQYENVLKTDNHGYIYFKNSGGDIVRSMANYYFATDAEGKERYEEQVFDLSREDAASLAPYGCFVTSASQITGNWSVTFPLESVR